MDDTKKKDECAPIADVQAGVDGVFRGLGNLLRIATELADGAERGGQSTAEVRRGGSRGIPKALHAVYGVSVRVGPGGLPSVARFGNVRPNARNEPVVEDSREPLADVLDEDDHYIVVVELPGVEASAVRWNVRDGCRLIVSAGALGRRYHREIKLLTPVNDRNIVSCYENGVLELKLWKVR